MAPAAPAGWPRDLPPAGSSEFEDRVVGWLLDRGPSELRGSGIERSLVTLAFVVDQHIEAAVAGLRRSYAALRAEVGGAVTAAELAAGQQAIERAGARLAQQRREVALVREAIDAGSPRIG